MPSAGTIVFVMTPAWLVVVSLFVVSRDWARIRSHLRAAPLNAGAGYAIAALACIASCPLALLLLD